MPLKDITRRSLEFLNQNLRSPGVQPGAVPGAKGSATTLHDENYRVADEFIRVIPFVNVDQNSSGFTRQYQVTVQNDINEPVFTAQGTSRTWEPGASEPFGHELDTTGTRFQKVSYMVRSDTFLAAGAPDDVQEAQIGLAVTGIQRALSKAILFSDPPDDDGSDLAGIPYYVSPISAQIVTYDDQKGLIAGISEIEARCAPGDDGLGTGADIFVMSSRCRWRLVKELEDKGVTPDYHYCEYTDKTQLHFHGIPVLTGPVPEGDMAEEGTYVYALTITGQSAVRVLHIGGDEFGVRVESESTQLGLDAQGEANNATMAVEVLGIYSVLVPDPFAVAVLKGVPVEGPI